MSGKKGLYVYQQIVKTTAEWALDDTVYPAHVFLLEELSNGKFNIAISDGEHAYSDLNPQFVDCNVSVLENTASSYKLRFVTPSGNYDTPNLKVDVSEVTNNSSQYVLQIRIGDTVITTPNLKGENAGAVPATAERLTLHLCTNQDDDTDLIGATVVITDTDANEPLLSTTWSGLDISLDIEEDTKYSIAVGNVTNYATPESKAITALGGGVRTLNMVYKTELVKVTVGTDKTNVSAENQQITINGSVLTVGASGVVQSKVPFGTSYSVSANAKSGYSAPATKNFVAGVNSRDVSMTYGEIKTGVFVCDKAKRLYTADQWATALAAGLVTNSDAMGVAVRNSSQSFIIAKEDLGMMQIYNAQTACNGATAVTDQTTALARTSGAADAAKMTATYGSGATYAAGACASYKFPNGAAGFLPAAGQMKLVYDNRGAVAVCMAACGGASFNSAQYWTSTYYGAKGSGFNFWYFNWSNGTASDASVPTAYYVRPFCAF